MKSGEGEKERERERERNTSERASKKISQGIEPDHETQAHTSLSNAREKRYKEKKQLMANVN